MVTGKWLNYTRNSLPPGIKEVSYLSHMMPWQMNRHRHGGYEMILCTSGCTLLEIGDSRFLITPGTLTLMPSELEHRVAVLLPPYRRWLLFVDATDLAEGLLPSDKTNVLHARIPVGQLMKLTRLFYLCLTTLIGQNRWRDVYSFRDAIFAQTEAMDRAHGCERLDPVASTEPLNVDPVLIRVLYTLHYAKPYPTVNQLAQRVHYSPSHLRRLFRATLGLSITDYIRIQRLEKSQRLLLRNSCEETLVEIARKLGFFDVSHFINYFKRSTMLTPSEYRSFALDETAKQLHAAQS